MDELMQRDQDAVVQQRLHADRLRQDARAQAGGEEAPAGEAVSPAPEEMEAEDAVGPAPAAGDEAMEAEDAVSPAPAAGDAEARQR